MSSLLHRACLRVVVVVVVSNEDSLGCQPGCQNHLFGGRFGVSLGGSGVSIVSGSGALVSNAVSASGR